MKKITMFTALKNFRDFHGRSPRREFWLFILLNVLIFGVLPIIIRLITNPFSESFPAATFYIGYWTNYLLSILQALFLLPFFAVTFRRMHDIGKSGYEICWLLLPVIGWVIFLIELIRPSVNAEN